MSSTEDLLNLSLKLLDAIDDHDWATYEQLCDPGLTAFEPEAKGHRISGMPFHKFYFDSQPSGRRQSSIVAPEVKIIGDAAIVTYIRLTQVYSGDKKHSTKSCEETRVWEKQNGEWKHIHFHRSVV